MGTSDVFKVFNIARAADEWNLKTLKASRSDHVSRNARAIIPFFVKNYKRIHLWYVLQRKTLVTFYRDLRARTTPV